jgi:hypothetical protein
MRTMPGRSETAAAVVRSKRESLPFILLAYFIAIGYLQTVSTMDGSTSAAAVLYTGISTSK